MLKIFKRLEQKNIAWMSDIPLKFKEPVNLVVDAFAGTFSVAKFFVLLLKHRILMGCEIHQVV